MESFNAFFLKKGLFYFFYVLLIWKKLWNEPLLIFVTVCYSVIQKRIISVGIFIWIKVSREVVAFQTAPRNAKNPFLSTNHNRVFEMLHFTYFDPWTLDLKSHNFLPNLQILFQIVIFNEKLCLFINISKKDGHKIFITTWVYSDRCFVDRITNRKSRNRNFYSKSMMRHICHSIKLLQQFFRQTLFLHCKFFAMLN